MLIIGKVKESKHTPYHSLVYPYLGVQLVLTPLMIMQKQIVRMNADAKQRPLLPTI